MKVTGQVQGDDRVIQRLRSIPDNVAAELKRVISKLAIQLQAHIVREKLSGQVLKRRTGTLARSIQQRVDATGDSIIATVGSRINESSRLVYAAIHEYGGIIPAHEVVAKAGMLKFQLKSGVTMFRKKVMIPNVAMPERSYVRTSLGDLRALIEQRLAEAAKVGANK
jgi:phage gpG-like protein